jgi:L,D-transpeptidase-like protein
VAVAALAPVCAIAGVLAFRSPAPSPAADGPRSSRVAEFLDQATRTPQPASSPLKLGRVEPLASPRGLFRWAAVMRPVEARRLPDRASLPVARLSAATEFGTTNIVLVLMEAMRHDELWVRVRLPVMPNNTTGWLPRSALGGYHFVRTHLVIDLERHTITLRRDGRAVFRASIGIGRKKWPTPKGEFYVREKLTNLEDPFYGPVAFGTSARSSVSTDWPRGGQVGIHGTNRPELIPGAISHGCVRMRNADILRLSRLLPVGTPLTIV